MHDPSDRASALAETFPTLAQADDNGPAPGVRPWDPSKLASWAADPERSAGQAHAARFVLDVWDPRMKRACGPFLVCIAIQTWDKNHREAWQRWAREPFTL